MIAAIPPIAFATALIFALVLILRALNAHDRHYTQRTKEGHR